MNKVNPRSIFDPESAFAKYDSDGLSVYSNDNEDDWAFMKKWNEKIKLLEFNDKSHHEIKLRLVIQLFRFW